MDFIKKYRLVLYVLSIILLTIIIIFNYNNKKKPKEIIIEKKPILNEQVPTKDDLPTIDFDSIRKKYNNKDIKGALRIIDADFENIVFQTDNNDYYLEHNYLGKKANGELFLDCHLDIDNSNIKIIYGQGTTKSNIIKNYLQEKYYNEHKYLELETDKLVYKYEIISLYRGKINGNSLDIKKLIDNSIAIYNSDISSDDEFIIYQGDIDNDILSIIGKRVKK